MINESVLAVVTHTGFNSKKGELIRCLLFPEEIHFKFFQDAKKFVFFLAILSTIGTVHKITINHQEP
jgi:cation-transporting ATPase 13A3/4/5